MISAEQRELIRKISPRRDSKNLKYTDVDYNTRHWHEFFTKTFTLNKEAQILDFGCGSGWGVHVAIMLGYSNIIGLDIDQTEVLNDTTFAEFHRILAIQDKVVFYSGFDHIPFADNRFDAVICSWSLNKDFTLPEDNLSSTVIEEHRRRTQKRIQQLARVSCNNATWYIRPQKHYKKARQAIKKHLSSKKITVTTWDVRHY